MNICIACPNNVVTGGVELLHQLCNQLNTYDDIVAKMWYRPTFTNPQPEEYAVYNNDYTFEPSQDSILIFPEIWAYKANQYKEHITVIYWESVDNYFRHVSKDKWFIFPRTTLHLAQSHYAEEFLLTIANAAGINPQNVLYLTDCLNEQFLTAKGYKNSMVDREPIILYNPAKTNTFTVDLLNSISAEKIALKNMTVSQMIDVMSRSMLYIDFGNHPGKDRIPREAALCGCCVITGKNGSARLNDVNIPNKYKFDKDYKLIPAITECVTYILSNYKDHIGKFEKYRKTIIKEFSAFKDGVDMLVERLRGRLIEI